MGQKLGAYNLSVNNGALVATCTGYYEYFGGKLLKNAGGYVNRDRLGSIGKFFPYGQERPSATTNGKEKFATYTRDAETGLDYAVNRYHSSGEGRFLSPDPYINSAGLGSPGSWNRYAYVEGDPINGYDPQGLETITVPGSSITVTAEPGLTPTVTFPLFGAGAATITQRTDQRPAYCFDNEAYYANPAAMPPECMDPNYDPNAGVTSHKTWSEATKKEHCLVETVNANFVSLALDLAGFWPGTTFAIQVVGVSSGLASSALSAYQATKDFKSVVNTLTNVFGAQLQAMANLELVLNAPNGSWWRALPIISTVTSVVTTGWDLAAAHQRWEECVREYDKNHPL
jgi:RHS repeat-associated protein